MGRVMRVPILANRANESKTSARFCFTQNSGVLSHLGRSLDFLLQMRLATFEKITQIAAIHTLCC
jgi:hypothetical protein